MNTPTCVLCAYKQIALIVDNTPHNSIIFNKDYKKHKMYLLVQND